MDNTSPTTLASSSRLKVRALSDKKILIPQFNDGITTDYCPEPAEIYSKAIASFRQSVSDFSGTIDNNLYALVSTHLINIAKLHENQNSLVVDFHNLLKNVIHHLDLEYKCKTSITVSRTKKSISVLSPYGKNIITKGTDGALPVADNELQNNHVDIRVCSKDAQVPEVLIEVKKTCQSTTKEEWR